MYLKIFILLLSFSSSLTTQIESLHTIPLFPRNLALQIEKSLTFDESLRQVIVIPGWEYGYMSYFVKVKIGNPSQEFFLGMDTGSGFTWVQSEPDEDYFNEIYNPRLSSSLLNIPYNGYCELIESIGASKNVDGWCGYKIGYGEGVVSNGDVVMDTIEIGDIIINNYVFGCGKSFEKPNRERELGSGMLGLGGLGKKTSLSFPVQVGDTSFSYCLGQTESVLRLGSTMPSEAITVPLKTNPNLYNQANKYYISLTGISVDGLELTLPQNIFQIDNRGRGGVILDSGCTKTLFESIVYQKLLKAYESKATEKMLKKVEGAKGYLCYDLKDVSFEELPKIIFHFGDVELVSSPALMFPYAENFHCLMVGELHEKGGVIGILSQFKKEVYIDTDDHLVGFLSDACV